MKSEMLHNVRMIYDAILDSTYPASYVPEFLKLKTNNDNYPLYKDITWIGICKIIKILFGENSQTSIDTFNFLNAHRPLSTHNDLYWFNRFIPKDPEGSQLAIIERIQFLESIMDMLENGYTHKTYRSIFTDDDILITEDIIPTYLHQYQYDDMKNIQNVLNVKYKTIPLR